MGSFAGYRTLAFGFLVAVAPAALNYLDLVDWTTLGLSPGVGALLGAAIMGLRYITITPIGEPQA